MHGGDLRLALRGAGSLFVALRGLKTDGAEFARQAIAAGAVAVVAERPPSSPAGVPWVVVKDARLALASLAAEFFGHPSRHMQVVGITGTNGKTTTAYLVSAIFEAAGITCGLMGTVAYRIGSSELAATRTTPEAPDVQGLMRQMVTAGCGACVMEVSSHALALRRVEGMQFAAGVFTNLTRDHLDFHLDMEDYFAAKRRLFDMLPDDAPALINVDDPRGVALADAVRRPVTYAVNRAADVTPGPLSFSLNGLEFDVRTPGGVVHVRSALVGKPNVYNILAAVSTAAALGVPLDAIERGLEQLRGVPGRFELASTPADDITVLVDYAHTDDALRNLLETTRPLAARRLNHRVRRRRRSRSPQTAAHGNGRGTAQRRRGRHLRQPRSEEPLRIIDEVRRGAEPETRQRGAEVITIVDRREAILHAVREASAGDVVLIAGKGHEKYQEIGGRVLPFDDVAVAREALEARRLRSRVG